MNFSDGNVDTNVFDTNTMLIPVNPKAIGLTDADTHFPISYSIGTNNAFGSPDLDGDIDRTPPVRFDVANPGIQVGHPLFYDGGGVGIPYRLGTGPAAAVVGADQLAGPVAAATVPTPATGLILHLHGKSGTRAEVLTLRG